MIFAQLWLTIPVALLAAIMHVLPWLSRRERLFGVTVTEEFRVREGRAMIRQYELRMLPWTIAAIAASLLLRQAAHSWWGVGLMQVLMLLLLAAATINVWRTFNRLPRSAGTGSVRTAELTASIEGGWWLAPWLLVPLAALATTARYLHVHWAEIPIRFPIHWNLQGVPNGWAAKSVAGVYGPLMIGGALILLVTGLTLAVRWGARRSAQSSSGMAAPLIVTWMVGGLFTMIGWLPLHYFPPGQVMGFTGAMLVLLAVAVAIEQWRIRRLDAPHGEETPDSFWHGGIVYFNPQDPALLVEKRIGLGRTFNFAHPLGWTILAAIVLIPVVTAILSGWPKS